MAPGWAAANAPFPALALLDREYAVASISYRLSQEALFSAQIEDCQDAVRWLRANAARYQMDYLPLDLLRLAQVLLGAAVVCGVVGLGVLIVHGHRARRGRVLAVCSAGCSAAASTCRCGSVRRPRTSRRPSTSTCSR